MTQDAFEAPTLVFDVTKMDAAIHQIAKAIDALQQGDIISAITLAGAAEGMLPQPDRPSAFQRVRDDPRVPLKIKKGWIMILNLDRDWLKHETSQLPDQLKLQTDDGAFMIVRALSKLPEKHWTSKFEAFKIWYFAWLETRPRVERFAD